MSSQDYAEMIEIPASSCEMISTSSAAQEKNKKKLVLKVNFFDKLSAFLKKRRARTAYSASDTPAGDPSLTGAVATAEKDGTAVTDYAVSSDTSLSEAAADNYNDTYKDVSADSTLKNDFCEGESCAAATELNLTPGAEPKKQKRGHKFNMITAQIVTIFVLAVGILLTNVFWQDSGINNLFKSVFSSEEDTVDSRTYDAFVAFSPSKNEVTVNDGIITVTASGAIYSPCEGKITSVYLSEGKYTMIISHSDSYKTVISGADYVYFGVGDEVFTSTPVCYSIEGGAEVAMYSDNAVITDYTISDGSVVWQN